MIQGIDKAYTAGNMIATGFPQHWRTLKEYSVRKMYHSTDELK